MDEIQQRIESFNNALISFNQSQHDDGAQDIQVPDGEDDIDEDLLPDPESLQSAFSGGSAYTLSFA